MKDNRRHRSPLKGSWADSFRIARLRLRLTMPDLARKADVSLGTATKILQGDDGVLLRHVVAVAEALGLVATVTVSEEHPIESGG